MSSQQGVFEWQGHGGKRQSFIKCIRAVLWIRTGMASEISTGSERSFRISGSLGADAIWICPVFDSPNADNGYDIRDYQSIMPEFGTMDDFDDLLTEAHQARNETDHRSCHQSYER